MKTDKKEYTVKQYDQVTATLIGTRTRRLQDVETGEVIEVDQITKRSFGQKAFWKVYLMDFMQILGGFEYKQLDVLIYIIEHTNPSNNTFLGTYRKIAEETGVSLNTVKRCINLVTERGFLKRIQVGAYIVSPDIMVKGNEYKKQMLLQYYAEAEG